MNTSALKSFAPAVRRQLIEAVTRKLDFVLSAQTPDYLTTFAPQVAALKKLEQADRAGLIERVAYTWFNRLAALRFMDARGWHPFRARVITPASEEETQPELLKLTRTGALPEELKSHTNPVRLNDLLDGRLPSADAQGEVYRHLVLAASRFYNALLPDLFEKLDDETDLLLPDDLLTEHSVVHGFRTQITDEDCAEVEILGWLYQFYISERKDQVMARKSAVPTEDIPAVTQLFTPHWIVRYLVENSLGRLWLLNRPGSRLREHMPYYIDSASPAEREGLGVERQPPAWEPEWQGKGIDFREGDYQALLWLRPNPNLSGDYYRNLRYAMSIDGYAYARDKWRIDAIAGEAIPKLEAFEAAGWDEAGFEDLRCCLFLVQRGIKWSDDRDGSLTEKYHAIYDALCRAWDREWRQHQEDLPDLARYGIHVPSASPDNSAFETPAKADFLRITKPEGIRLCDPAVGSGHMLTYAFDLLTLIYEEEGYAPSEIPALILRHNLVGIEICPRAAQLAELALVFKAREKSRHFFQPDHLVRPRIIELRDVRFGDGELSAYFKALDTQPSTINSQLTKLLHQFEEAKNFGSLIQPCLSEPDIQQVRATLVTRHSSLVTGDLLVASTHLKVLRVLEQAEALTQRYHVVVANPPYMGSGAMNGALKQFAKESYPDSKADLFAMFMERGFSLALPRAYAGMITMQSWMFLSSYEELRVTIVSQKTIVSMAHLGARAFDTIGGEVVQSTAFVLSNAVGGKCESAYFRLVDGNSESEKSAQYLEAIADPNCSWLFRAKSDEFQNIPGSPIAYWVSKSLRNAFRDNRKVSEVADPRKGMVTADNPRFIRSWWEPTFHLIGFGYKTRIEAKASDKKWFPYQKGGEYRKWYGNHESVINWEDDGREMLNMKAEGYKVGSTNHNLEYIFKPAIVWTKITSSIPSFRKTEAGFLFDDAAGLCAVKEASYFDSLLGLLCSRCVAAFLKATNPTMNLNPGNLCALPVVEVDCSDVVARAVEYSRADWDNFETSWDFRDQPLLRPGLKGATLEASWRNWEAQCTAAIRRMQELETENNRLFIAAYGLNAELQPEVPEAQITLARAEVRKDMAAFLSYAVGCMMGRYSLAAPGLILANAGDTLEDYHRIVTEKRPTASQSAHTSDLRPLTSEFHPDADGIVPVLDGEWFEDDIVARTRDFLRATFGEATLRENLRFIEDSLGKDLRKYFLNDFYKDHLQTYKKRPIYWMVQSPRKGFSVLLYLHRYTRDTMNLVLNRYLRDYQVKLRNRLAHLTQVQATAPTAKAKTEARKEADKLTKTLHECDEWERQTVLPLAQARIELDLDDGVKVNYLKLGEALAPIAGLAAKEED